MLDIGGPKKERPREADELESARKLRRNAEIDHEVSILRQKAAKFRKDAAKTLEKARRLELSAVELETKANDLERSKIA